MTRIVMALSVIAITMILLGSNADAQWHGQNGGTVIAQPAPAQIQPTAQPQPVQAPVAPALQDDQHRHTRNPQIQPIATSPVQPQTLQVQIIPAPHTNYQPHFPPSQPTQSPEIIRQPIAIIPNSPTPHTAPAVSSAPVVIASPTLHSNAQAPQAFDHNHMPYNATGEVQISHHNYDHNDHRRAMNINLRYIDRGYYVPRHHFYWRDRPPIYYSSNYYSGYYIAIQTAIPYVEVRCDGTPIVSNVVGGAPDGFAVDQFGAGYLRSDVSMGGDIFHGIYTGPITPQDESCAYQALEYAHPDTQVTWVNPQEDVSFLFTPGPVTRQHGEYCREYQAQIMVDNEIANGYGQACRLPDGSWQLVDD